VIEYVAVVVPARNEGERLARSMRSVRAAVDRLRAERTGLRVRIVLVLDSCTDDSNAIASRLPDVMRVHCSYANVGAARGAGVRWAMGALRGEAASTWIASTDADSEVPDTWLVDQVRLAERGWDVTLGAVVPVRSELTPGQRAAWDATHPHGAIAGHVHGANLGVRASVYLQSGGFESIAEHEDARLVDNLRQVGARVVGLDGPAVITSGRAEGRTPGGYAGYLAALEPAHEQHEQHEQHDHTHEQHDLENARHPARESLAVG